MTHLLLGTVLCTVESYGLPFLVRKLKVKKLCGPKPQ